MTRFELGSVNAATLRYSNVIQIRKRVRVQLKLLNFAVNASGQKSLSNGFRLD